MTGYTSSWHPDYPDTRSCLSASAPDRVRAAVDHVRRSHRPTSPGRMAWLRETGPCRGRGRRRTRSDSPTTSASAVCPATGDLPAPRSAWHPDRTRRAARIGSAISTDRCRHRVPPPTRCKGCRRDASRHFDRGPRCQCPNTSDSDRDRMSQSPRSSRRPSSRSHRPRSHHRVRRVPPLC